MPVRLATTDDLNAIADMGFGFMARTRYAATVSPSRDEIKHAFAGILVNGRIWVAEIDGVVRGFLAGIMQGAWFAPNIRIALEAAWWMDEDFRGRPEGVRLLLAFERWAKEEKADAVCMSDIVIEGNTAAASILERLGYAVSERTFFKATPCTTTASERPAT